MARLHTETNTRKNLRDSSTDERFTRCVCESVCVCVFVCWTDKRWVVEEEKDLKERMIEPGKG